MTIGLRIKRYRHIKADFYLLVVLIVCSVLVSPAMAESVPIHIRIGFSSNAFVSVPKEDIKIAVQVLSRKVATKTVGSAESRVYDTSADIEKDLKTKKLDVVAMTPEEFIHLSSSKLLEPVMVTVGGKDHEVELLMLARKDSGLNRVADLKKMAISLPSGTSQYSSVFNAWIESLVMKEGGGSIRDYFSSLKETRNASQSIMPVFFRKTDACITTRQAFEIMSELNPQIARELKVIAQISRLTGGVVAFRQDLPDERKQRIRQALMSLHEDQEGRQMFMLFQLNRLTPFRPEYLKATEALYSERSRLMARRR